MDFSYFFDFKYYRILLLAMVDLLFMSYNRPFDIGDLLVWKESNPGVNCGKKTVWLVTRNVTGYTEATLVCTDLVGDTVAKVWDTSHTMGLHPTGDWRFTDCDSRWEIIRKKDIENH